MSTNEAARQHEAYLAVRNRLWKPLNAVAPPSPKPNKSANVIDFSDKELIASLRKQLLHAERQINEKQAILDKLALDLADANARILSMAEIIANAPDRESLNVPITLKKPVKRIIDEVLRDYPDVTWEDLKGVRRTRRLIEPRQRCMYELYSQRPDLSFPAIGRLFGGRDHTTVLHSVHKIKAQREKENA